MCLICVDFQRQRMTLQDAQRALREMITTMDPEHAREVKDMIQRAAREQRAQAAAGQASAAGALAGSAQADGDDQP